MWTHLSCCLRSLNLLLMQLCVGRCSGTYYIEGGDIVCDWYFVNIRFWYRGDDQRLTLHTETVDAVYADSFEFAKALASQRNPVKPWEMLFVERVCTRRDKEAAKRLSAERLLENMRFIKEMEEMLR
jgi:hypothetical protein